MASGWIVTDAKYTITKTQIHKYEMCESLTVWPEGGLSPMPGVATTLIAISPLHFFTHSWVENTLLEPEKIVPVLFDIEGIEGMTVELASVLCHGVDLTKEILPSSSICCKCLPGYTLCYLHCTTVVPALSDIV